MKSLLPIVKFFKENLKKENLKSHLKKEIRGNFEKDFSWRFWAVFLLFACLSYLGNY